MAETKNSRKTRFNLEINNRDISQQLTDSLLSSGSLILPDILH